MNSARVMSSVYGILKAQGLKCECGKEAEGMYFVYDTGDNFMPRVVYSCHACYERARDQEYERRAVLLYGKEPSE
jgi:hypothetical protein